MPGKDSSAVVVLLALPHNAHSGPLEAEVESADTCEEGANGQHPCSRDERSGAEATLWRARHDAHRAA
jgi:hypothetical protein